MLDYEYESFVNNLIKENVFPAEEGIFSNLKSKLELMTKQLTGKHIGINSSIDNKEYSNNDYSKEYLKFLTRDLVIYYLTDLNGTGKLITMGYNDFYPGGMKAIDRTKNIIDAAKDDLYGHFIEAYIVCGIGYTTDKARTKITAASAVGTLILVGIDPKTGDYKVRLFDSSANEIMGIGDLAIHYVREANRIAHNQFIPCQAFCYKFELQKNGYFSYYVTTRNGDINLSAEENLNKYILPEVSAEITKKYGHPIISS